MKRVAVPAGGFRHIAVLRLSSLGDVVLTLPVVHELARAFPTARITFWTKEEYADVVAADPAVAHVRRLEKDARGLEDVVSMGSELEDCDLIVDLHGNARARTLAFRQRAPLLRAPSYRLRRARWVRARWTRPGPVPHALARYAAALRPLGLDAPGPPRMTVDAGAAAWAAGRAGSGPPPLALCPGARHATKQWPEEHWVALVQALRARGVPLIVLALPAERRALPALEAALAGDPSAWCSEPLPRMAALLSCCRAAVTHDSGLMHVAAARGARVVALFGSTSPVLGFAPAGEGHVVLCRDERCQPCTLHGQERCPQGHFDCMRKLAPEQVLAALERIGALAG
jgi:heptosyltransferase II